MDSDGLSGCGVRRGDDEDRFLCLGADVGRDVRNKLCDAGEWTFYFEVCMVKCSYDVAQSGGAAIQCLDCGELTSPPGIKVRLFDILLFSWFSFSK